MVSDEQSEPQTLSDVLRVCLQQLRDQLPEGWSLVPVAAAGGSDRDFDAVLSVSGPDGTTASLVIEAKRVLERRNVLAVSEQLRGAAGRFPNAWTVVVARYLAPSVREALAERGVSYIDATGNMRLVVSVPGLFIANRGADNDPWRGPGRPRGTLKGVPAAKVVRALMDYTGPWSIRELIDLSGASTGATYRVVEYLEREDLVTRNEDGKIVLRDWRRLLQQWSKDYGFVRSSRITRYIEPRGLATLLTKATDIADVQYAVTGTTAAAEWAPYAPARSALVYVADAAQAAAAWGLRPAESGANVLLAEPATAVVFERTITTADGTVIVAPAQVAVDLMTGPGRNPAEAEELMDWMERNESSWRLRQPARAGALSPA
ncbi:hypothetical protein E3O19_06005 [Cryobacterium algoritolerans]|uniref:HTH iclR-type domain-containing protein n=1 Tax=Cryobacterium algoritolerans TaxID=1259184 RepID=A0A4R8WWW1_9MICO|nr:type IV toxin-antitoxin system AbiEi family antitoxin [Cryobacterium algoritolerans]TFC17436.1 hypothetical protein E3O19_06005 [Cryobacterium algoritolerans]